MPAPDKVLTHGAAGPTYRDWNELTSVTGPDEVTFVAQDCPASNTVTKGQAVPGYPSMSVVEARSARQPGGVWHINCRGRGLITGNSRIISAGNREAADGWDERHEKRMELVSTTKPRFGLRHPSYGFLFLMASGEDEALDLGDGTSKWCTRDRTYRGLIDATGKVITRKITVNGNVVSPKDPITVNLPGGWPNDARKSQVSLPRIVVSDTTITIFPPPTDKLPGRYTPIKPPAINLITITGVDLTWNWPSRWTLSSIDSTELFLGAGVHHQTLVYEWVYDAQF